MGRVAVRAAVTSYLQAQVASGYIPYVGTVFAGRPMVINERDYVVNMLGQVVASANGSAAVLVVNLLSDERTRRADTGRGAQNDTEIHTVAIELFFGSTKGDAVAGQDDYDAIVDAIVQSIRNDATLGAPLVIWSAGEYTPPGVRHEQREPTTTADGLTLSIPGVVQFEAWEWIAGETT